jgi:hypothetical protein
MQSTLNRSHLVAIICGGLLGALVTATQPCCSPAQTAEAVKVAQASDRVCRIVDPLLTVLEQLAPDDPRIGDTQLARELCRGVRELAPLVAAAAPQDASAGDVAAGDARAE